VTSSKPNHLLLHFGSRMSCKRPCAEGLVPSLVLWEVQEPLEGGSSERKLGHCGRALEGMVGPWPLPLSLSFAPSSLLLHVLLPRCTGQPQAPKQKANVSCTKSTKSVPPKEPFLLLS
jgi:hypothetical protein